ncbi:hypothetical protein JCM33374_g5287 [Metschnikowia sp. JCM 33374]|nr:hypothetical protein JCM33374_g5287 [Metschnikowia sp. JCM 33374]
MVRRSKRIAPDHDDDSLSDEIEDVSSDLVYDNPRKSSKKHRVEDIPWSVKYEPHSVQDVSINPRKVKEVREIFTPMAKRESKCRLLVLSGPAGSSKSTLAKCLAEELFSSSISHPSGYVEYLDSSLDAVGQAHHFQDFLDGCRYLVGASRCMVLVEDLPNVFHPATLASFRQSIRDWIFSSSEMDLPPLVLCLTEVEIVGDHGQRGFYNIDNCLTVETILGRDLLSAGSSSGQISRVKFLPVAKTYIKKSLQRIVQAESSVAIHSKQVGEILNGLCESGDIRSSICNLEFMCKSTTGLKMASLMRESQISLFHAVGKVIHSSSKAHAESLDSNFSVDYESVRSVVDNYHNFGLLHLALLENYQIYNGSQFDLDIAANIVDNLSLNDTFTSPEASHDFALRSTRHALAAIPVKSSRTLPMKFPRQFKSVREENKVRVEVGNYTRYLTGLMVSFEDVNLLDGYFVPRIKNSQQYRRQFGPKPFLYNRIGGSFREIYADENLPVLENDMEMGASVKDQFSDDISAAIQHLEMAQGSEFEDLESESDAIYDSDTDLSIH